MEKAIIFCLFITSSLGQEDVVKRLSDSVGETVLQCQQQLEFEDHLIKELREFWNESIELTSFEVGCTLVCVLYTMEFLDENGEVQQAKVQGFTEAMGADKSLSAKFLELFVLCKNATNYINEKCVAALELTKCFRYGIFQLHWAPPYVPINTNMNITSNNTDTVTDGVNFSRRGGQIAKPVHKQIERPRKLFGEKREYKQSNKQRGELGERLSDARSFSDRVGERGRHLNDRRMNPFSKQSRPSEQHRIPGVHRDQHEQPRRLAEPPGQRSKRLGKRHERPSDLFNQLALKGETERRVINSG